MEEKKTQSIVIISDLHLEFYHHDHFPILRKILSIDNCNTLIIAGDFGYPYNNKKGTNKLYVNVLKKLKQHFEHIVYVAGNHDYFQAQMFSLDTFDIDCKIKKICDLLGIHFLQKDSWIHPSGIEFVGCTLWSNITEESYYQMNDSIKVFDSKNEYDFLHQDHKQWLDDFLLTSINPTIVVTHHLPSLKAITNDVFTSGYATNLEDLFVFPVIGWICGHTHEPCSILINDIPLYINPIGYKGQKSKKKRQDEPFIIYFT